MPLPRQVTDRWEVGKLRVQRSRSPVYGGAGRRCFAPWEWMMPWSFQIARVFDIPIRLHLTFLLLLGWLGLRAYSPGGDPVLLPLAVALFACVLLHELGHSLTARRFGIKVADITLLPIGGLARMNTIPRDPRQELWITAAGPAVNFVLAPLFFLAHRLFETAPPTGDVWAAQGLFFGKLAALNLGIGLFNLLPAFPMDGGRILRALLALKLGHVPATKMAASLGQLLAFGMGFLGLMGNPMLIFIALFIFIGAAEEGARAQTESLVTGVPVRDAMMTRFFTLERADNLGRAADLLLASTQHDFPVLEGGQVVGVLTRRRLLESLAQAGREVYVTEVMEPSPEPVSPDTPLEEALNRLVGDGLAVLPVSNEEGLCGLLSSENAGEFVMIRAALRRDHQTARHG
jgi:Zn-dependent protease/CBS domain-containing protein